MATTKLKLIVSGAIVIASATLGTRLVAMGSSPTASCAKVPGTGIIADSETSICFVEPEKYTVVVYEIGICKTAPNEPTTSAAANLSTCVPVFKNSQGETISVAKDIASKLPAAMITAPPSGNYSHGYMITSSVFKFSGKFEFQSNRTPKYSGSGTGVGNFCWTKPGTIHGYQSPRSDMPFDCGSTAPANAGEIVSNINSFDGTASLYTYQRSDNDGLHKAYLVTPDLKLASSAGINTMGTGDTRVDRILGIAPLPVAVTGGTQTLDLTITKSKGAAVVPDRVVGGVQTLYGIYSGPPSMVMKLQ